MTTKTMDWKRLEEAFASRAQRLISQVIRQNPDQTFYAIALYESYRELDAQITLPWAAINSLESLAATNDKQDPRKYTPPDWQWNEIDVETKEIARLTAALQEEANRSTQAHWYRTEKRFLASMVRVIKRLYAAFKDHPQTTADFIAYFDDESAGDELLQKCIPKRLFVKHFGKRDEDARKRHQVAASSTDRKLATYLSDVYEYEDELVKLGAPAVNALIGKLKDKDNGSTAARILGRIGIASEQVVRALRAKVRRSSNAAMWSAKALGMLGDADYLLKLTDNDATREDAISGIVAPLQSWVNGAVHHVALDYRTLERLFAKKCRKCNRIASENLKPGSSFVQITTADIDEAIRGMQSPYVVIRRHAVCVLGERSLGKVAAKKILPALVEAFADKHSNVRYLAVVNLGFWKAAAKPYKSEIRKMLKDSDPLVRAGARSVLSD